jgi:hypothetical protein
MKPLHDAVEVIDAAVLNACEAPANQRRDVHVRVIEHLQVAAKVLEVLEAWYKAPNTMSVSVVLLECRSPATTELEAAAVGGTIDSAAVPVLASAAPAALGGRATFPRRRGLLNGCRACSR